MYSLVKFLCDSIFHVNTEHGVRFRNNKTMALYGRCWYEAEIVCKYPEKPVLIDICKKLNYGGLRVRLNYSTHISNDVKGISEETLLKLDAPSHNFGEVNRSDNNNNDDTFAVEVEETFFDPEIFTSNIPEESVTERLSDKDNIDNVGKEDITALLLYSGTEIYDFEVLDDGQLMSISTQNIHENNPKESLQLNYGGICCNFKAANTISESIIDTNVRTSMNEKESHASSNYMDTDVIRMNNNILHVPTSKSHKKKYYCSYCMKLVTNFGRHILTVHVTRKEVGIIAKLPKGHPERKEKIASIRRQAQYEYNTNAEINCGTLIVCRRPSASKNRSSNHYIVCPSCKEMFSKLSLRSHVLKCAKKEKGKKDTLIRSRQIQMHVHEKASLRLVKEILAYNKQDIVTETLVYDEVCILYGNKLCRRYRDQRHNHMIRSRLREIGKFILQSKKIDITLEDLRDIIQPKNYDTIVKAINNVAGFDEMTGTYKAPSTAYNLGLHIKEITLLMQTEAIKEGNNEKRDATRDLVDLINDGFKTDINKTVTENQSEIKRHKKVLLPTAEDINALKTFLEKGRAQAYESLKSEFKQKAWRDLAGYTLISLQLFNRRRAGELERILTEDFKSFQFVDTEDILQGEFKDSMKYLARNYARFFIRGKLNRQVPVILSKELINCVEMLLEYRDQYGVPKSNPYLFGVPGRSNITLKACNLMRYYAKACGAPNPTRLRGTELRKQIATACALYKLSEPLVEDMANHLGHHIDIHKKIYRQSIGRELPVVTNILLKALGEFECEEPIVDGNMSDSEAENDVHESETLQACQKEIGIDVISRSQEYDSTNITTNQLSPVTNNHSPSMSHTLQDSGKQKRVSWTSPEIEAINRSFGHYVEQNIVPTYDECHKCRAENLCLQKRTPPQIKSFVAYQTKKLKNRKNSGRKAWSPLEKIMVENKFAVFLKTKKLPSLEKCREVIATHPELKDRKPEALKAFINNINKKTTKEIS